MNGYMTFQPTGGASKKFAVTFEGFLAGRAPNKIITRKPNGQAVVQVGATYRVYQVVASIMANPASGYASVADVEGWFADQTVNGSTGTLTDHNSTPVTVAIKNEFAPQYLDTMLTRALIPIIFEQVA